MLLCIQMLCMLSSICTSSKSWLSGEQFKQASIIERQGASMMRAQEGNTRAACVVPGGVHVWYPAGSVGQGQAQMPLLAHSLKPTRRICHQHTRTCAHTCASRSSSILALMPVPCPTPQNTQAHTHARTHAHIDLSLNPGPHAHVTSKHICAHTRLSANTLCSCAATAVHEPPGAHGSPAQQHGECEAASAAAHECRSKSCTRMCAELHGRPEVGLLTFWSI